MKSSGAEDMGVMNDGYRNGGEERRTILEAYGMQWPAKENIARIA